MVSPTPTRVYKCRLTHPMAGIPELIEVNASPAEPVSALVQRLVRDWGLNPQLIPIAHIEPRGKLMKFSSPLGEYDIGIDDEIDIWAHEDRASTMMPRLSTSDIRVMTALYPDTPLLPMAPAIDEEGN
jgi:hypothetical protein